MRELRDPTKYNEAIFGGESTNLFARTAQLIL